MEKFLVDESPVKVVSLLATALSSMFLLFMVTASTASFQQAQALPDPFGSAHVVAMLDSASSGYSKFLNRNLFEPASQRFGPAFQSAGADVAFVSQDAGYEVALLTGSGTSAAGAATQPEVAGASTQVVYSQYYPSSHGVFSVFFGN